MEGWSSGILRVLATGPATLAEIDAAVESHSCQSLERRLAGLHAAGLVEAALGPGRSTSYAVTEWLRQAIGPFAAAVRWERKHLAEVTPPIAPVDAEAGLLLSMPLISLPTELSGSCRLGVEFPDGAEPRLVGVTVDVEGGRIASCTTRLESSPAALGNRIAGCLVAGDDRGRSQSPRAGRESTLGPRLGRRAQPGSVRAARQVRLATSGLSRQPVWYPRSLALSPSKY